MSPKPFNLEEVPEDNPFPAKISPALFDLATAVRWNLAKERSQFSCRNTLCSEQISSKLAVFSIILLLIVIVLCINGQSLIRDGKKTWN